MEQRAFSLVELLVVITILGTLGALGISASQQALHASRSAHCSSNLHQLGMAVLLYTGDHSGQFFRFREDRSDGVVWYFGFEPKSSLGRSEGERELDAEKGPLYPYIQQVGGVEICKSFPYQDALWKPKFKGASYGYGYNLLLGGGYSSKPPVKSILNLEKPGSVIVFGDCAQVNSFQSPASSKNPMVEEFYAIDDVYRTIHFRHQLRANFLFADGHVEALKMHPGTEDTRLPKANIGRITPRGSLQYLQ